MPPPSDPSVRIAPGAGREHGVIHDIGYRHYDGPRLGRQYIRRSLFTESTRGAYGLGRAARTKIVPMLLLAAMCLPAVVIAVVAAVTGAPELPSGYGDFALNLQVLVAVFVASQAPALVSRDLRFGVVPLYFSRPIERIDYVLAKYAAMSAAVFVLVAAPLTILFAGALLAEMPVGDQLPDYLRSLVSAGLLAVLVAAIGLVIAAVTPRRGLGVAAIVTVLIVLIGVQTVVQNIAAEEGALDAAAWSRLISPFTLVNSIGSRVLGEEPGVVDAAAGGPPGALLVAALVLLVAACFAVLVRRYRTVSVG